MAHNGLIAVHAGRPPEITGIGDGSGWKFEAVALAEGFEKLEISAAESERPTLSIFGYIGDDGDGGGITAKRVAGVMRAVAGKPLLVEINSPGGNYFDGVAIYNLLRRHDAAVDVDVLGIAASAASVIAMAGDTITVAHNAEIMIHEARGVFFGTKSEMADAIDVLAHIDRSMAETYAARSGRPVEEFEAMIAGKDVYFRGQEAIDAGLADLMMDREAQMPVYSDAKNLPNDKASLDKLLADQGMSRTQRRDLFRAIGSGTSRAANPNPATPRAGAPEEPAFSMTADQLRRLAALSD